MNLLIAWIQAARFPSQLYLLLPVYLGQLWAEHAGHPRNDTIFYLALTFALLDQLYIVFANDYADQEADAANLSPTLFSGGSRVLVDGKLSPLSLLRGAQVAALGCLIIAMLLAIAHERPWSIPLALIALLLLWAYSFKPIQASYRGLGALLQTLGIAVVLPIFGFYVQAGNLEGFAFIPLGVLAISQFSCAMATALPDITGDKQAGKQTLAVKLGHRGSQILMAVLLLTASIFLWSSIDVTPGQIQPIWLSVPVVAAIIAGIIPKVHIGIHRMTGVAVMTITGALAIEVMYILALFQ
jgi:1,4-dihydroxy-2-naphthoate octaprenyltransferase